MGRRGAAGLWVGMLVLCSGVQGQEASEGSWLETPAVPPAVERLAQPRPAPAEVPVEAVPADPSGAAARAGLRDAGAEAGLVAHWTFDDGSATDLSGRGHDGIVQGGAEPVALEGGGYGLQFDGKTGKVVVPDHPDLHLTGALTLAARVRPQRLAGLQTIVNKWYALDSYMLLFEGDQLRFSLAFPDGSQWGLPVNLDAPAEVDRWYRVAGTFDGKFQRLFVDGVQVGRSALPPSLGRIQDSSRPLVIGHHPDWNAFQGLIDEVRIYSRPLGEDELRTLLVPASPTPRPAPAAEPEPEPGRIPPGTRIH